MRVGIDSLVHEQRSGDGERPMGVGELVDGSTRRAYGLFGELPLPPSRGTIRGLSRCFVVDEPSAVASWREAGLGALAALNERAVRNQ